MNCRERANLIEEKERAGILDSIHAGTWRIECPEGGEPQLYGDAGMYAILGADTSLTPQQFYRHWHERIDPAYAHYVDQVLNRLVETGNHAEVEYAWNHPRDGKRIVRCNGMRSAAREKGSFAAVGLHWDITAEITDPAPREGGLHIIDHFKVSLFGKYLIGAYEDVLLIDIETRKFNLIAYRNSHCGAIMDGGSIMEIVEHCVCEMDRERMRRLFSEESLRGIIANQRTASIDIRRGSNCGQAVWVRSKLYPIRVNGVDEILLIVENVENEYRMKRLQEEKLDALCSVLHERSIIYEYDIKTQSLQVIKNDAKGAEDYPISLSLSLQALVERFCREFADRSEWGRIRAFLSRDTIRSCVEKRQKNILAVFLNDEKFLGDWARVSLLPSALSDEKAYIAVESIDKKEMLYPTLKSFIRNSVDFFYFLDLKNDYFFRFIGSEEEYGILPAEGRNYTQVIQDYVDQYIPAEERALVRRQMDPAFILSRLEDSPEYAFYTGFIGPHGEARRKRIVLSRHDLSKGQVMLQRIDVTELYRREQRFMEAQRESVTDALTQLYNRLGSERTILKALEETDSSKNAALIMLDLDNFKKANDMFGHQEGDRILREAARRLKEIFRAEDIVGRMGGDEFVVFLPSLMNKSDIYAVLQRVVEKMHIVCGTEAEHFVVTASVGATVCEGQPYEQLYREADTALYHAKEEKDKYSLYSDDM